MALTLFPQAYLHSARSERFVKLQKNALRAIFGLPYWVHTAPLFIRFSETSIIDKMMQKLAYSVWHSFNQRCETLMSNMYSAQTSTRTRGSSSNSLILHRAQSLSGLRRPAFVSAAIWNSLPAASRLSVNKRDFIASLPATTVDSGYNEPQCPREICSL